MTAARLQPGIVLLAAIAPLLALRFGGYHVRHAGWVVLGLVAWACLEAVRGRLGAARSAYGVASISLVALVGWTTASISWADVSTHDAWVEAVRTAGYAAAFVLGGALLARARSYVAFVASAAIGTVAIGAAAVARMRWSDAPLQSFVAGRLDWPVGYAPATAGMFLFAALLLLGLGTRADQRQVRDGGWPDVVVGALSLGGAGACAALALLAQSRGTVPALMVGLAVSVLATPKRGAWLLRAGAVAVALFAARSSMLEPYSAMFELRQAPFTEGADEGALLEAAEASVRAGAGSVLLVAALLCLVGGLLVAVHGRLAARGASRGGSASASAAGPRVLVPMLVTVAAIALTLLVLTADRPGSPGGWVAAQVEGCLDPPATVAGPGDGSSYFGSTGTGRCDYYRVALSSSVRRPLLGLGAGNFRGEYVLRRETSEEPRVVHSLPLQLLAELGIVGALLGAIVASAVAWAAWRFVRSGPTRDAGFAGALGAIAYWAAHASIDWLWQLPAVSLPAIVLAGGLAACVSPAQARAARSVTAPIAAGVLLAAVALVLPVTMADLRLREARDPDLLERDLAAALAAARDARAYDPGWAEAALTEAVLQQAAGRRRAAARAARDAVRLEPRNWSVQYRASGLIGLEDTRAGQEAVLAARRLNPQLAVRPARPQRSADPDALQDPDG